MTADEINAVLQTFKMKLLIDFPFYGDLLLRLPIMRDDSVPTACTDGRTIRWSASFFGGMKETQIRYVLMHEVFHTLLMHPLRFRNRDHRIWNIAADIIVNQMCDTLATQLRYRPELKLERPDDGIFCRISHSETLENLYERILADNQDNRQKNVLMLRKDYSNPQNQELFRVPLPAPDLLDGKSGGLRLSDEEREALEQEIRSLIRSAASDARGDGASSLIARNLLQLVEPKPLDWRKILKDFLSEVQSDDTSYATPERKYLHTGLILPGHGLQEGGDLDSVWAFVDSSGSVGQEELNQFLTQLYRITKDFGCVMNIAYWDTSVTDVYTKLRTAKRVLEAQPMHSGGTNINCVYRYILERKLRPTVALILTDGYFGLPDPVLKKCLDPKNTILLLCNDSENPIYKTVGRVCRLNQGSKL